MEIVAIGTSQFVIGFSLAGVRTHVAQRKDVLEAIERHKEAGIIILDEELVAQLHPAELEELQTSASPVVLILGKDSAEHERRLRNTIKTTLGVDLFT